MEMPKITAVGIYNSKILAKNTVISQERVTKVFEIELPIEDGGVSYINKSSNNITTDIIIFSKPGEIRHTKFPYSCYYVHIEANDPEILNTLHSLPNFIHTAYYERYLDLFKRISKYYNSNIENCELILQSILLEIIFLLNKDANNFSVKSSLKYSSIIKKATEYIKENLSDELTLETVANYVSVSPIHFHNIFKSAVGQTLREYIEDKRIKAAIHLLSTTDLTLTEIAYNCGFSSQSYFSFVFKRKLKTTPRKYLEKLNEQYEI